MPRIGFTSVAGAESITSEDDVKGWGPPDPVYFPEITERIQALDAKAGRWFVTLLNVGTHHPFDVEDSAPSQARDPATDNSSALTPTDPQEARRLAMAVMEEALGDFLRTLAADGILENTLVIITSDESGGFVRQNQDDKPLNNNAGVLAIRPPDAIAMEQFADRDRIVAQLDVPLTILDATGLGDKAGNMIGRSLLVPDDDVNRDLLLADTYTGLKYFIRESGVMLACTELLIRCDTWTFDPKRLFGSLQPVDREPFLTLEERLALFQDSAWMQPADD